MGQQTRRGAAGDETAGARQMDSGANNRRSMAPNWALRQPLTMASIVFVGASRSFTPVLGQRQLGEYCRPGPRASGRNRAG